MLRRLYAKFKAYLKEMVSDDNRRNRIQFLSTFAVLGAVSLFMTVVNIFTGKILLMWATLSFTVLLGINVVLTLCGEKTLKIASVLFMPEILILIGFFIVSGSPEGFSAIWAALIPACSLLLYRKKKGSILSLALWLVLLFFFWTPVGQSFLRYEYTTSFKLRFPFLYFAFYMLALILEIIRAATFDNYIFMFSHDPLTGALNRRGFWDYVKSHINSGKNKPVGFAIFDLDHFKLVNDTYGHFTGDLVLQETKKRLSDVTGIEICRWGGEEFALLASDTELSQEWIDRVVSSFSKTPFRVNGEELPITISAGAVSTVSSKEVTADMLCKKADICLYEAKEAGRNRGVFRELTKEDLA